MSNNPFAPAVRQGVNLRALLIGQSGSGKTYSALAVASHLAERIGTKVAVVDTEDRSAEKYAHEKCACAQCRGQGISFVFDVLCLKRCSPDDYMNAMRAAHANGYGVIVLDSISHEWEGPGGCLEIVDANQRQSKNKHAAWGPVTEKHNQFLAAIRNFPGHVVATVRAKEKHQKEGGKIVSLGVLPVQRDGIEYEFDLALFLDQSRGQIVKTRASKLEGWIGTRPGAELANAMLAWANGGEAERDQSRPAQPPSESATSSPEAEEHVKPQDSPTQAIGQVNREPLGDRDTKHANADSKWRGRAEAAQDDPGADAEKALESKRAELCEWARHLPVGWAGQLLTDLSNAESLEQLQAIEGEARAALSREEVARG